MKIKYNIPMLNRIREGIHTILSKNENKKLNGNKIPIRYYTLLIMMIMLRGINIFSKR